MKLANELVLKMLDGKARERRQEILSAKDDIEITGTKYYVSCGGSDENSGLSGNDAWRSLDKVNASDLKKGDAVLFRRGDLFRGQLFCRAGVTYAAWGEGEKPRIYGWEKDLADPALWEEWDREHHIWHMTDRILDCGTLVFNGGERHSLKHIPSWVGGKFVCRDDQERDFIPAVEMTGDLDIFCDCRAVMTEQESHGETWPVPKMCGENLGDLYLKCDEGNPGEVFGSIEALPGRNTIVVGGNEDVRIDNLCLRYCGAHAIGAGGKCVKGLHVTNCEIGWVGGTIQHYFGTDPNYPEGTRGSVTRFGNGIEIYGGCDDYLCANNYVYQVYDAGVTHQVTVPDGESFIMKDVRYTGNLIEYCVYSIEYFLSNTIGTDSLMDGLEIDHNILRFAGYGWGQQRHNTWTPAHIKSWTFENPSKDYTIHDNLFDRSAYRLLHLCCAEEKDYPAVDRNTYVQTFGRTLGQFGADLKKAPPILSFYETSDSDIEEIVGDRNAGVYYLKEDRPL